MRLAILSLFAAVLSGQPLRYSTIEPAGAGPSARIDGTIVHDPISNQLFLFGGEDSTARNDLWSFSLESRQWQSLSPAGAKPDARWGHTLNYDPVRRRLILFGGQAAGFFSDLWAYDITVNQWTRLADNGAGPSRRYGHSGIYDKVRNRVIVSHGFTDRGRFDDTWAFDLATNRWSDISPSTNRPLRRCLHHAVYDTHNDQMFLYGGCASGFGPCPLGDLWSFDLRTSQWREIRSSAAPPPRQHYGFAYDEARRRVVLFGGSGNTLLNDTWEFDPVSLTWTQLNIPGAPAARLRHQGIATPDAVYFFGGNVNGVRTGELLRLAPSRPTIVNAFSHKPGPFAPGTLVSIYGTDLTTPPSAEGAVLFASPTQINLRLPENIPLGPASILNTPISIVERAPGVYPVGFRTADVLVLYVTGANESIPGPVTLLAGGLPTEVLYAAQAPGIPGVMQVNARIAPNLASPLSVVLRIANSETSTLVTINETP